MPDHGYPRYPTHAIAECLGIAVALAGLARTHAAATRRITHRHERERDRP